MIIPSLDILDGRVVRLTRGDYTSAKVYGDPEEVLDSLEVPDGSRLHVVDLNGSRDGKPAALEVVRRLAMRDLRIQVGGGIRTPDDARQWIAAGAAKIVTGTVAAEDPAMLGQIVRAIGAERVIAAIDILGDRVRIAGWQREAAHGLASVLRAVEGIGEILVTDIRRDGVLAGPSFDLYRRLAGMTEARIIASGGVATLGDVRSLARMRNVSGCVIGKALLERRFSLAEACEVAADTMPDRIIPCLDIRDGRVVKGVNFAGIRDAGDPVECARAYEAQGADELVVLDISASDRTTIRRIADSLFIPLTVGGGVRSIEDFRGFLRAGADRVAINTAAVKRPELIREAASEFGVQAVVLSCDAKEHEVMIDGGRQPTGRDAIEWCREAEGLGAGEILLTSVDRDGTNSGFDLDLLRAVSGAVRISLIASGGAGQLVHFRDAIEQGGARAVLAASLFHDGKLTVGDVKQYLANEGIPVR